MTNPITCNTFCASSNDVNLGSSSISFSEIKTEITGGKDSKSKGKSVKRTKNDVSGGIDNKLRGKSINRSKTDLLGEVDNKLKLKSLNRMRTDVFAGVDSKLREKSILRQMNDILGGVDSKTKIASLKRILSELITAVDTESRIKDVYRAFYDCLDNLDGTERFKEIYRELTDFFDAVDNQSKVKDIFRGFIDYIEGYDTKSQEFGFNRLFSEVIELLDIETRTKTLERAFGDITDFIDTMVHTKIINRVFMDLMTSLDIKSRLKRLKRKFTDRLETLDTKLRGFKKIFKEKLGGKDLKKVKNKNKVFTEKVGNLDWWYDPVVTVYGVWHMNETGLVIDNTTIAHDSSPNHTHLTCTGITSDAWMSGKLNNSLYLKTGSHVSTEGSHFSFERTDIWSFEMWFRANSIGNVDFFRKGHSNPSPPAQLRGYFCEYEYVSTAPSDKWRIEFLVASSPTNLIYKYWPYPLSNFPAGSWHHIVFTYDGSSTAAGCKCYINGAELTNSIVDNNNLTESILNYDRPHFDYITSTSMNQADEMVLWGLVLTPEEVLDRYNNGIGKELDYHWAIWLMYAGMRDTLRWFMNHGKYRYSDITEMKDTVTRIIKYSLHHGHQHWWRDKPKQKVVVGD